MKIGSCNNKNGLSLLEVMMIIAIALLLYSLLVSNVNRSRIDSNDSLARTTLRSISTACEMFASDYDGAYPVDMMMLTGATPPYIGRNYCGMTIGGFLYACDMNIEGYNILANPMSPGVSGSRPFSITTGGHLVEL